MVHLCIHPEDTNKAHAICLDRIPKKLKERLIICPTKGTSVGWGLILWRDGITLSSVCLNSSSSLLRVWSSWFVGKSWNITFRVLPEWPGYMLAFVTLSSCTLQANFWNSPICFICVFFFSMNLAYVRVTDSSFALATPYMKQHIKTNISATLLVERGKNENMIRQKSTICS